MKNECFPPATRLSGWVLNRIHDRANDIATELLIFLTHDWSSVDFQQPCTARAANRVLTQQAGGNSLPYVVFASRHCGNSACSGVRVGCTHKPSDHHLQSVQAYSQHPTSRTLSCQIWAFADGVHTVCTVARSCTPILARQVFDRAAGRAVWIRGARVDHRYPRGIAVLPLCKFVGAAGRGDLRDLVNNVFAPHVRANGHLGRCTMGVKPSAARIGRPRPGFSLADHQVESQVKFSPIIPAPANVYASQRHTETH
jgi:hypothetical protein